VNADHDRDRQLDDALTRALRPAGVAPAGDACLDAETVAAWMDGGLDSRGVALAEAHASNCARCQALLGTLARTTPAVAVAEPRATRLWRWWFAPLAATAAAVTLWMVVPQEPASRPVSAPGKEVAVAVADPEAPKERAETAASAAAPAVATPIPPSAPALASRDRANVATPLPAAAEFEKLADKPVAQALEATGQKAEAPRRADSAAVGRVAAAAPPAAPPLTAELRKQADQLTDAQITARSTPSPGVIWLVGRAGMVQLATDGRTFARVPFPETVDLTAVTATDERHAIVTTADGRTFQTADAGRTWRRQ
jgi:hypothetical protein